MVENGGSATLLMSSQTAWLVPCQGHVHRGMRAPFFTLRAPSAQVCYVCYATADSLLGPKARLEKVLLPYRHTSRLHPLIKRSQPNGWLTPGEISQL